MNIHNMSERSSGILLHISSLASRGEIGTLGKKAYEFVDFLARTGTRIWQVLPVGPTGYGDSPYQSFSVFAGNPYFIDIEMLRDEGLLSDEDVASTSVFSEKTDYFALYRTRLNVLRKAFKNAGKSTLSEAEKFVRQNRDISEFAFFSAVKEWFHGIAWQDWDDGIRSRSAYAIEQYRRELSEETAFHGFVQYLFFRQWLALKSYANKKGVLIFGDMPIYAALDSSDVWSNAELFSLDENLVPKAVAGVPPDYFSEDGQLWGNPLYDWEALEQTGYDWWVRRMKQNALMFDIVRIDHFIGLVNYYCVPFGAKNARSGVWRQGPGKALFNAINGKTGRLRIVAEDLGTITDNVLELMDELGLCGMRVMCFGFDSDDKNGHIPFNVPKECVYYTGTHDNDTIFGTLKGFSASKKAFAEEVLGIEKSIKISALAEKCVDEAFMSKADTVIVPFQDICGLDSEARMNTPGICDGSNWRWRMNPDALSGIVEKRLSKLNIMSGRYASLPL